MATFSAQSVWTAVSTACNRTVVVGVLAASGVVGSSISWLWPVSTGEGLLVAVLGGVLLLPSLVVFLFRSALSAVLQLPGTLVALGKSALPETAGAGSVLTVWRVAVYLFRSREKISGLRDSLASASALIRVASVPALIVVMGSAVLIGLLAPISALIVVLTLVF